MARRVCWRTPVEIPMTESTTNRAMRRLVDRAAGALISRRSLVRSALTGAAAISLPSQVFAQATPVATPGAAPGMRQPAAVETWTEPGIWRPSDWPGRQLDLNVTENENPGAIVGFGNETAVLFSYGGGTPGPTIRMRGDEVHGMMQVVETTSFADHANYELRESVASTSDTPDAVTAIYPRLDQAVAWSQSLCFVDPNHLTGQTFPGFVPGSPLAARQAGA